MVPISRPKDEDAEERAWITDCLKGDVSAFKHLVTRYRGLAYSVAYSIVGDREEARDISQEAFIRTYRALNRFNPRHRFSSYLYRVVANLSIDYRRRRKASNWDRVPDQVLEKRQPAPPGAVLEQKTRAELLHRAILKLPDKYREVIIARELQGHSYQEIGETTGCRPATLRWRVHRGREILRERLEKYVKIL